MNDRLRRAPRCTALTAAGATCRQPAMRGRDVCRMHRDYAAELAEQLDALTDAATPGVPDSFLLAAELFDPGGDTGCQLVARRPAHRATTSNLGRPAGERNDRGNNS